ncbi:hypothetical protein BZG02_09860 [Labilibaculum filiforme]|uniref:Uncharacterized protein n=1 Tax=Labilibaculum filiforme TaxID=1940526 RepID=A0A2N3HYD7_9BACT|nr:hypothetical protein [Labilibaculum filiforme]PKQ63064.1 hypothetical protein BZG02_09860 [Labilibaculum filiforme]
MSEKESVSSISSIGKYFLSYPFQDFPSIPENSTQNLMDYADGQQLRKYQWDDIHNLRDVKLWGQEEEGNASHDVNINGLITWIKGNKGSHLDLVQNKFYNFNVWGNKALETKLAGQKAWVYSEVFDDGKIDLQTPHVDFVINEDYHSGFYLSYKYEGKSEDAVRIWTYSYSDFELLLKDLEYPLDDKFKTKIVASYEEYLEVNGADCNKIDVVFENIPDFVNATISIEDRIKYLKTISGCSIFNGRWIWGTENDTNEGLAVLNLLKTKDEQQKNALFYKLENENKLLIDLYGNLGGDNLEQFIQVLSGLAVDSWSKDNLDVDGNVYYIWNDSSVDVKGRIEGDVLNIWSHIMPGSLLSQNPIPINNEKFDPLEALAICYNDGEVASDDKVVYLPALYLYWVADNKDTEDGIKSVSFFLNFVGAGSASKVLFKGGTYLAKVLAIAELSNFALNTLITNPILAERLKQTDEGKAFLDVWPTISTAIDLTQISTELLTNFVKNSKSVSNVLSDLPEAEAKRLDDLIAKSDEVLVKRGMPGVVDDILISKLSGELRDFATNFKLSGKVETLPDGKTLILKAESGDELGRIVNNKLEITNEQIVKIQKDYRPSPSLYMSKADIANHLNKFRNEGGAFIIRKSDLLNPNYTTIAPRKFIGLKSEMDEIVARFNSANYDTQVLIDELDLGDKYFKTNDEVYLITVKPDKGFEFDMPSGNENGAYDGLWVPGGKTKHGTSEAVLSNSASFEHSNSWKNLVDFFGVENVQKLK